MKRSKFLITAVVVALIASLIPAGAAYAPTSWYLEHQNDEEKEDLQDLFSRNKLSEEEIIASQEEVSYIQEASKVMQVIDNLPDNAGYANKKEIEKARMAYNNASYGAQQRVSAVYLTKLMQAETRAANPNAIDLFLGLLSDSQGSGPIIAIITMIWLLLFYMQIILAYGTAYRKTKAGGDSGVALFGWLLAYSFAAIVPFLGVYLWKKSKTAIAPTTT